MPGETELIYTLARRTLLDALEALGDHRRSVVVVGAQAIYLHTGEGDLAVSLYTSDADLAVDPRDLAPDPKIESPPPECWFRPFTRILDDWHVDRRGRHSDRSACARSIERPRPSFGQPRTAG